MRLSCEGCRLEARLEITAGKVRTSEGIACHVTFADAALVVWECPGCRSTNAEDLTE